MIFSNMDRIVFAGDSVTDMGSTNPVGEGLFDSLGQGYVRIVDSLLAACYPEIKVRVTNSGISGNTSRDLLARFDRDVVELKPDWVSICIGINDVWRQFDLPALPDTHVLPKEYERNVEEMILRVKDTVKGIFILSPYIMEPNSSDMMRARMNMWRSAKSLLPSMAAPSSTSKSCTRITAKSVILLILPGIAFTPIRWAPF